MTTAASVIRSWRENPAKFVYDNFRAEPDPWQMDVLNVLPSPNPEDQRIAMQACAGPGKSAILAWTGWWFLMTQGDEREHPKGAAVSITASNLADNLWPELSKWQAMSPVLMRAFEWTKSRISSRTHPNTWFLSARAFSQSANVEEQGRTLSGLHSKYVLALVDEGGDIPHPVLKAAEQALSTAPKWGKILMAGNPTSHHGALYTVVVRLRGLWRVFKITGDPENPKAWVHSKRIPPEAAAWARQQIATYGREDPWVMALILGEFPPASINALLSPAQVEEAMARHYTEDVYNQAQKRLGIDVAREGDDRTVIFPRQGLVAFKPVIMRTQKGFDIAARVAQAKATWKSEMEIFDDTGGWAGAAIEAMIAAGQTPIRVNFSGSPVNQRYANKRAEMWFHMADWVKRGGAIPNIPELVGELVEPTYTFDGAGRFLIEPKKKIKERLKRSPDLADALALTFAFPEMPAADSLQALLQQANSHKKDWDPYADA